MKRIIFTVTNDLNYDQRMMRICSSLAQAGYEVTLTGAATKHSLPLSGTVYSQKWLTSIFNKGKLFYIEYNIRLLFFLLFKKTDLICAIDLDTIIPCYISSKVKKIIRVYDAHELFCEMKEVVTRPVIYRIWKMIERYTVPRFKYGYTVNEPIRKEFERMYSVKYEVIRNIALFEPDGIPVKQEGYIIYQGAVNEGRSFETLIPAMQWVDAPLIICGDGNFMSQVKNLVRQYGLENKVILKGKILPKELKEYTLRARAGVTLFDKAGMSNYYSLANRFFDYIHAGIPQLCVNYPVYAEINNQYKIGVLLEDLSPEAIAEGLNLLLKNDNLYRELQQNCLMARKELNWQKEEQKLLAFYKKLLGDS